jgi:putative methyltransferase (TIGR04325 family)
MNIFSGVFKNANNLNSLSTNTLDVKKWGRIVYKKITNNKKKNSFFLVSSPLLIVLSLVFGTKKCVRLLDIGGGGLDSYFDIMHNYQFKNKILIDNVELPSILSIYKKFNYKRKNLDIDFYTKVPKKKYDLIHISDSLHYVSNTKEFINTILSMNASYIVLNNTRIGNNPTYATFQKFYKHKIPTWFFNDSIKKIFLKKYSLIFESEFINKFFSQYSDYPMKNLPSKYRIKNSKTIIFKLK